MGTHVGAAAYHAAFIGAASALARKKALNAEIEAMTPEARAKRLAELTKQEEIRHEWRDRAREAFKMKKRTPKPPRWRRPAPERTRRFCQPVAMTGVLDPRLSPGASRCLVLIVSECGRYTHRLLTNGYLGSLLSKSARQVQRYVSELTELGYIKCWPQVHPVTKCTIGRFIKPLAPCYPYWHPDGPGDTGKPLSHWTRGHDASDPDKPHKPKNYTDVLKRSTGGNPAEDPFRRDPTGNAALWEDEIQYGYDPDRKKRLT